MKGKNINNNSKIKIKRFKSDVLPIVYISSILDYEVRSSVFAQYTSIQFLQKVLGKYYAWKTARKYARYIKSKNNLLNKDI